MANMTKKILAASLKKQLAARPLDKITIQDLVNDAQVSRKTFYYHFQDIYDLLEWALVDEGRRVLEAHGAETGWQEKLWNTLVYLQENRAMVLNICRSARREDEYLERHLAQLLFPLLEQHFDTLPQAAGVTREDRQFLLDLYAYGLVKLVLLWICEGMKPAAEQFMLRIHRLFDGSMEDFIQRCLREA
ncbi:MAG: TetR family transcriptional regulator [Oscillospiraceae bacterium]|nr:TetR family transcriptional regulator [Oscillospiraceae bacterium]